MSGGAHVARKAGDDRQAANTRLKPPAPSRPAPPCRGDVGPVQSSPENRSQAACLDAVLPPLDLITFAGRHRRAHTVAVFSDAERAALYDLLNPWNPKLSPGDRFYHQLIMAADSVLDVGCGTGAMLACAVITVTAAA